MIKRVYLCYQSGLEATVAEEYNTNVLGIADSVERAQELCCNDGDSYGEFVLNRNYGRSAEDVSEEATYNVYGKFIKGWSAANEVEE